MKKQKTREEFEERFKLYRNDLILAGIIALVLFIGFCIVSIQKDNLENQLSECQEQILVEPKEELNYTKVWKDTMCEMAFVHNDYPTIEILNCEVIE